MLTRTEVFKLSTSNTVPIYILDSTVTGKPYLTEDRKSHIFFRERDAEGCLQEYPDTRLSGPYETDIKSLMERLYASGTEEILLHDDQGEITARKIDMKCLSPTYPYNADLNAAICLLKQIRQKKYLEKIGLSDLFMVAGVRETPEIKIVYGTARVAEVPDDYWYVVFSDLAEYNVWKSEGMKWNAIRRSFAEVYSICKGHGLMINPCGNRLVLSPELVEAVPRPKARKDEEKTEEKKEG